MLERAQSAGGGWSQAQIGNPGAPGTVSVSDNVVMVGGAGADIWGGADAFHYYYQQWTGDGIFIVRVTDVTNTDAWAKAGIMVRADLSPGSPHMFVSVNPNRYASAIWRETAGGASQINAALDDPNRHMPMWLKMRRNGDQFSVLCSGDGISWHDLGLRTLPMAATVYVGLAVTSHVEGTAAIGTFDNISFNRLVPGPVTAVARAPARINVSWQDEYSTETGWELQRSTDNVSFSTIWTQGVAYYWTFNYTDEAVVPSTTYYYRVRAQLPWGPGDFSPTATVRTPPASPAGWTSLDIGTAATGGSTREASGAFTLSGAGLGVGGVLNSHDSMGKGDLSYRVSGAADEMQFCGRLWSGDGEMVARITSLNGGDSAQAGIVVRTALGVTDGYEFCGALGTSGAIMLTRDTGTSVFRATSSRYVSNTGWSRPMWVKLVRAYGGVMSFASSDGVNWQQLGWATNPLSGQVYFGLTAASGIGTALATATFDNVSIGPVTTPIPPPPPPGDFAVSDVGATYVRLGWSNPISYDRVILEWSTDGVNFTPAGVASTFSDLTDLKAATTYTFRLRGLRGTLESANTTLVVKTEPAPLPASNLTATAATSTRVELRWTDNTGGLARYEVYRSTDNVQWNYLTGYFNTGTTSHTDTSVIPGTTYYYQVRAINGSLSALSNIASVNTGTLSPTGGPTIAAQPASQSVSISAVATLSVATTATNPSYQWLFNGQPLSGQNQSTLTIGANPALRPGGVQPADIGLYTAVVTDGSASVSRPAILGLLGDSKVSGTGSEVGPNIVHPNGNIYDQVLLTGGAASMKADAGQVLRTSFVDLNGDIVQVEMSGAGTLTINLAAFTGPNPAGNYNQPGVSYMQGHAGIVIAGADESTNVSVFSVGRATAINQTIFRSDVVYDGMADVAYIAILSSNGRFGGIRAANTSFFASNGLTGIYAPNVAFSGPVYVGDISAANDATANFVLGSAADVRVAGGDLTQLNGRPVLVSGISQIHFTAGTTSHGVVQQAQANQARFVDVNGADASVQVVVDPP